MESTEEKNQYFVETEEDANAVDAYIENIYSRKVYPPKPPAKDDMSFFRIAGIEAVLFTISAISVAVLSSIRTGMIFFILEEKLLEDYGIEGAFSDMLSLLSLITALLGFEGYLLAIGFAKGKNNSSVTVSKSGMWFSFAVIIGAGIFSGLGLLQTIDETLKITIELILALITGIGAGVVAYSGGENIGFTFAKVYSDRKIMLDQHQKAYQTWRESGVRAYQTSHYNIRSKNTIFAKNVPETVHSANYDTKEIQRPQFKVKKSKKQETRDFVEAFIKEIKKLPTTDEIERNGFSRGYANVVLNEFIVENYAELLEKQLVNEKRVEMAKSFVERQRQTKE